MQGLEFVSSALLAVFVVSLIGELMLMGIFAITLIASKMGIVAGSGNWYIRCFPIIATVVGNVVGFSALLWGVLFIIKLFR